MIELLIAIAMASVVMAAIVSAYQIQVRGKNTQEALTDMNQTARTAMEIMTHEIRMAGCDPTGGSDARIITADAGELIFSLDIHDGTNNRADGDCCDNNEVIRYVLSNDSGPDGVNDDVASGGQCNLWRETGAGNDPANSCGGAGVDTQPLGRNIDALNFVYLDSDGTVLSTPVSDPEDIRRIQVTLVARAGEASGGFLFSYTNSNAYANQQADEILSAQDDSFRRLRMTTTVSCRNMGM